MDLPLRGHGTDGWCHWGSGGKRLGARRRWKGGRSLRRWRIVVVVGGGISAVQLLDEISQVTSTTWVTRREPVFRDSEFGPEAGRAAVAMVEERVRSGLPPGSVVSVTGLLLTDSLRAARDRGAACVLSCSALRLSDDDTCLLAVPPAGCIVVGFERRQLRYTQASVRISFRIGTIPKPQNVLSFTIQVSPYS